MIVHEACLTGGFGGEIAARIGEELFDFLAAPVARIGAKDVPMPFSPVMEDFVVPQVADIVACAEKTIKRKRV
jgi:pyruvate/2-oxoglutarate/acetoin dehydrogenase E1 component